MTRRNNSREVPSGHPRRLHGRAARIASAAITGALLAAGVAACGGGDAAGATVTVYVAKPLCAGAKDELSSHGATAGSFKVAIECLAATEKAGGGVDLAANGSNSRRATEDSSAVATLEEAGPGTKFSRPILESAGIPLVISSSGRAGMDRILNAVEGAGTTNVRESVQGALESA